MAKPFPQHNEHPELLAFGRAVRKMRLERGLSQEVLATDAGIDRSYMGGVERGEHNLALLNQLKIAKALGLRLSDIMKIARL